MTDFVIYPGIDEEFAFPPAVRQAIADSPELSETYAGQKSWRSVLDPQYGVTPAKSIKGVNVAAGSTAITAPAASFTPAMNGYYFYLRKGGPVLAPATTSTWEASPNVGTFTYVSATSGTLSSAATSAVTAGEIVIGPDATAGINAAIATGSVRIPAGTDLIVASEIIVGSGQTLEGDARDSCRIFSPIPNANVIVSAFTTGATVKNLSVFGNGYGVQPANVIPTYGSIPSFIAALAGSGCGVTFARAVRGLVENVAAYHCGGDMTTSGRNGIAGIYVTYGCYETQVVRSYTAYCRNGINEDSYFSLGDISNYSATDNTFESNVTDYCIFGLGIDSSSTSRGAVISNHTARYCGQFGVGVNSSKYVTIINPRVEYCGRNYINCGIQIYGTSSTVYPEHVTIINPNTFANGTHGIKISEWARDVKIIGGTSARNLRHGLYIANGANDIKVLGFTSRTNAQGDDSPGEYDGIKITSASKVHLIACHIEDDQTTKTQNYGVRANGTSDEIFIDDATSVDGFLVGRMQLVGASSRSGTKAKAQRSQQVAQGLTGESFPRAMSSGSFAPAAGDQRAVLVGLNAGERIANLYAHVTVAGTGLTLAKLGVWDSAGSLLASTADLSATFNSGTGPKGGALSSALTVPADGGYYVGAVFVGGTPPTLLRGTSGITGYTGQAVSGGAPPSVGNTAKTDIGTMTITASGNAPWLGWTAV
jgi:hypothetical protein